MTRDTNADPLDRALARLWMADTKGEFHLARKVVLDIVAARLAAVEALADEWETGGRAPGEFSDYYVARLRAALHADASEAPA